jgi:polar amino acid transport system substrate-binding protein
MNVQLLPDERFDAELTAFLTDEAAHVPGIPSAAEMTRRVRGDRHATSDRRSRSFPQWIAGGLRVAGTAAIALVVVLAVIVLRGQSGPSVGTSPSPSPSPGTSTAAAGDLLAQVRQRGVLRFAIRPDFPQAAVPGLAGFDIDVGKALASHMGLLDGPVRLTATDMLGAGSAGSDWDVALPSSLLTTDQAARFTGSGAYYYWPVHLLVPTASTVAAATDLGGKRICVVAGSSGEAWLAGRLPAGATSVVIAPTAPVVRTEAADRDCAAALTSGAVDAMVTSTYSDSDLAARPTLRTVGGPLFIEPRTMVASREGPDPSALLSAIDDALGAMRSDATLADLSRNRFGGRDLSIPPTTP